MGYSRAVLGDPDDPSADDFGDDGSQDPRAAYVAWAAAVKRAGGTVSHAPHLDSPGDAFGIGAGPTLAAQYLASFVFPHAPATTLNPLFTRQPNDWSNNGQYVFYVAPELAQAYAASGSGIEQPQQVPGEPAPPDPKWYTDLIRYSKYAAVGLGVIALLNVASYVPRSRSS